MKIVQLSSGITKSAYGVGAVVLGLSSALIKKGADVECWTLDSPKENTMCAWPNDISGKSLRSFSVLGPRKIGYSFSMERWARDHPPDVIHQHMLWMGQSRIASTIRKNKKNLISVIAAHGSLDSWALKQSPIKKALALKLYESKNLEQADCFHATSDSEVQDYLRLGMKTPIALIENGISDLNLNACADPDAFRERFSIVKSDRILMYISRITPKKNIPFLIDVLSECKAFRREEWRLVIVGDWDSSYAQKIKNYINDSQISDRVIMVDPLWGRAKDEALAAADCIVLPSLSEGNPMILLESLAVAVPIIVCAEETCPPLKEADCGWTIGVVSSVASEKLEIILSEPDEVFCNKGIIGKSYITENLTWSSISNKMLLLYAWLNDRRKKPSFIIE